MNSYVGMVWVLDKLGRAAESETFRRKEFEIQLKLLGEDRPHVADRYERQAQELYFQGKYAEAELLYHKVLAIRLSTVGEDDTAHGPSLQQPSRQPP